MALNIKNARVERLATEVARITGETKTEAIRRALEDRKNRLALKTARPGGRISQIKDYLEREVWPHIPADLRGKKMTKREREEILGIGPDGYPE
jgi:antitoxin VapB